MSRTHWTLAGLLAAQIALIALLTLTGSSRSGAAEPRALLPALEGATATRVVFDGPGGASTELRRGDGRWVVEGRGGFPADGEKLDTLLADLAKVRVARPVVATSRYHDALKVADDDFEARVRIWTEGGDAEKPAVDLYVGTSPNYRVSHVRLAGDDRVFEARGVGRTDLRPDADGWIDRKLVEIPSADLVAVRLSNGSGRFALRRGEDGAWTAEDPGGAALDAAAVDAWISSVASLRLAEPAAADASTGLEKPTATLELESKETSVRLLVGDRLPGDDGRRYATREGLDRPVVIGSWEARKVVEQKLDDLRVK